MKQKVKRKKNLNQMLIIGIIFFVFFTSAGLANGFDYLIFNYFN